MGNQVVAFCSSSYAASIFSVMSRALIERIINKTVHLLALDGFLFDGVRGQLLRTGRFLISAKNEPWFQFISEDEG